MELVAEFWADWAENFSVQLLTCCSKNQTHKCQWFLRIPIYMLMIILAANLGCQQQACGDVCHLIWLYTIHWCPLTSIMFLSDSSKLNTVIIWSDRTQFLFWLDTRNWSSGEVVGYQHSDTGACGWSDQISWTGTRDASHVIGRAIENVVVRNLKQQPYSMNVTLSDACNQCQGTGSINFLFLFISNCFQLGHILDFLGITVIRHALIRNSC